MRSVSWMRALVAAGALTLLACPAFAQEASEADIAQARQLGTQAEAADEAGNYAESEKLWAAAQRLYPKAPTLSLGLARAQAKRGHVVDAQENYNEIIREWGNVPNPSPAFKDALDAARAEVGSLAARIANVVITVEGPPSPAVTIDGQPVNVAALGLKRPVDPGPHTVHAEAQGWKPADAQFTVAEGGEAAAKLTLEKAPDEAGAGATPPAGDTGAKKSPNKTIALAALGVGGVGIVVGAITGVIAIGKHGSIKDACGGTTTCPPNEQSDIDGYKTMGTISTVGFIVGAVGVAAGAVLWLTAPKESASVSATPYLGLGSAGVAGHF